MNKIIALLLVTIITSCEKEDINNIPSYITINSITLDENSTHNITDAWVYIDDDLQGVYELPANFPLLVEGEHKLRIKAGIKDNGIASTRVPYPFYSSYIVEDTIFNSEETMLITPIVYHLYNPEDIFHEDFETGLNLDTDSITFSIDNINPIDGNYSITTLTDSILLTEIITDELVNLPQAGAPVYLELDYRCNTQFLVGLYVNFPQSSVLKKDLLWINPKENWNKIYVNLTSTVSESVGADFFKVFIGVQRDFTRDTNTVYLDNLRIIY